MRTRNLICFALAIGLIGCSKAPRSSAPAKSPATSAPPAKLSLPPNLDAAMAGTWLFHFPGDETDLRIELAKDGHWKWWPPVEGSPPAQPTQTGTWFVHQQVLVLRVETSESDKVPAGLAFTYEVRSVTAQAIVLYDIFMKQEFTLKRAA